MKDEEKKKKGKLLPENEQKKKVKKIKPEHKQEQEELFKKSDQISPANKKIDTNEFVQLNGDIFNIDDYIRKNFVGKATHFYRSFYYLIADLLGVSRELMKPFVKPLIVPLLKRILIYGRFPNAVQIRLYKRNPYTGYCTRTYWNYQWLTQKADSKLRDFIVDFEREGQKVLDNNGDMKTFITEYCRQFNIPIQLDLFDNLIRK